MTFRRCCFSGLFALLIAQVSVNAADAENEKARLAALDAYWQEVVRCVQSGDFEGYVATIHKDAVLVSGPSKKSYPLSEALKHWKKEFAATKAGKSKTELAFRWNQRFGDATTAHETGMFRYAATSPEGKPIEEFIDFEALLLKRDGKWQIIMEYQKAKGTKADWDALK